MKPAHSPADRLPGDAEIYGEPWSSARFGAQRMTTAGSRCSMPTPLRQERAKRSSHRADRSNPAWTLVKAFSVQDTKQIDALGARALIARQAKGDAQ
jgi:hypothetical protein